MKNKSAVVLPSISVNSYYSLDQLQQLLDWCAENLPEEEIQYICTDQASMTIVQQSGHNVSFLGDLIATSPRVRSANEQFLSNSASIANYLATEGVRKLIVPDSGAPGFIPMQWRRSGAGLQDLECIVQVTGGQRRRWDKDELYYRWPVSQAKLEYCEAYCLEQADTVFFADEETQAWCEKENIRLAISENRRALSDLPGLSICVAHYNYGQYLPALCKALAEQDYQNIECIIVDDGSTKSESKDIFLQMREQYGSESFLFIEKENEGIGATRNFAANQASGDHLIFVDADNLPLPHMAGTFARAVASSGLDCLTCHYSTFTQSEPPISIEDEFFRFMPIGPAMDIAMVDNVLGDANFCIKKKVFDELGGFTLDRDRSFEDYEFLANLVIAGYELEVIPETLLWYRFHDSGFSRVTSPYKNHRRVTRVFEKALPEKLSRLTDRIVMPYSKAFGQHLDKIRNLNAFAETIGKVLISQGFKLEERVIPDGAKYGQIDVIKENVLGEIEIHGWCGDPESVKSFKSVLMSINGVPVASAQVNRWRTDAQQSFGLSGPMCGFKIVVAPEVVTTESKSDTFTVFAVSESAELYPLPVECNQ